MNTHSANAPERSLPLEQARRLILKQLDELGLRANLRTLGADILCVQASLLTADSKEAARGAGKGLLAAAEVGALYEALEHYLSDNLPPASFHRQPFSYFASHPHFASDDAVNLLVQKQQGSIVCRTYRSLVDDQPFSYPLALTCPRYNEFPLQDDPTDLRALRRYSSNNGTAIGASYDEALLHALNESIERDALSVFLLNHFYYQRPHSLRRIDPSQLSPDARAYWRELSLQLKGEVILLDISSEFCATTCLAFINSPCAMPTVYGTGTSLTPNHAAWRALTELAQLKRLEAEPPLHAYLLNAQRHLAQFPRLLRCLQFNTDHLLGQPVEWVNLQGSPQPMPLSEQIAHLVKDLAKHGLVSGVCTLFKSHLGTALVNVVVPGLERFFLVSTGNIVVPHRRGRDLCGSPEAVAV
ncbi:ribosomal protein S12 methylthiotransferase accessory factor [Pseudomonas synxantha]|uniref:Bacteriocin biosynthesis docking scaffold, SagD family n=1 Tax=Pseudomonas synxantha TaxID=47883 RepID=A0AAX3I5C8_9PSED|nr:YcaO-like family protein [Pseudomonas synxantha]AZE67677.1 hypothetical protein C4K01_3484 [Pseudomonas synxantha]SDU20288.1 ribosomal protein S12 methylthiotransferase accessory factor [Pseudomonas synxantha]VTQ97933.1 bacteriocin biosynthesis docking scaffold, SagD family [Pseudomonas synxantha]